MDELNIKLHYVQHTILKKLVTTNGLRFNDLLMEGLESEHMNYHLKRLLDIEFVEKDDVLYKLSDKGKNYSNLLDDQVKVVERQPKSSILLRAVRKDQKTGEIEHLLTKRLRHPYFGKVGRLTGKVRFGETLQQAAERELYEETGLKAKKYVLEEIHHKMRYRENGVWVQDVVFFIFFVTDLYGSFIQKTEYQENMWVNKKEFKRIRSSIDTYEDLDLEERFIPQSLHFTENIDLASGY